MKYAVQMKGSSISSLFGVYQLDMTKTTSKPDTPYHKVNKCLKLIGMVLSIVSKATLRSNKDSAVTLASSFFKLTALDTFKRGVSVEWNCLWDDCNYVWYAIWQLLISLALSRNSAMWLNSLSYSKAVQLTWPNTRRDRSRGWTSPWRDSRTTRELVLRSPGQLLLQTLSIICTTQQ